MKRAICILLSLAFTLVQAAAGDGLKLSTVVIDAGHGGKDPGAVSSDRKTQEKNITLDVAKRLAELIRSEYPDVKVILTRDKDVFVPLDTRADIANKANANLFISIHVNAAKKTSAHGYSIHVLGQSSRKNTDLYELNMEAVKRENAVIMLEDDYTASYEGFDPNDPESYIFLQLMQNAYREQSFNFAQSVKDNLFGGPIKTDRGIHQDPFLVLWRTSMPSVLVELGFISNATDLETIRKAESRQALAGRLFDAFKEYKTNYDRSLNAGSAEGSIPVEVSGGQPAKPAPDKPAVSQQPSSVQYGVQIFAGSSSIPTNSPKFLGYTPRIFKVGSIYKYVISVSGDLSEVTANLSTIRKTYRDAFIVEIEGETVRLHK